VSLAQSSQASDSGLKRSGNKPVQSVTHANRVGIGLVNKHPDEDSQSSTATDDIFSESGSSLSDEESIIINKGKNENIFANLESLLDENRIGLELKLKIVNEVENIITKLRAGSKAAVKAEAALKTGLAKTPTPATIAAPKKKLLNGISFKPHDQQSSSIPFRRPSEDTRKYGATSSPSPVSVISCSPNLIKSEPIVSPMLNEQPQPQMNCVH